MLRLKNVCNALDCISKTKPLWAKNSPSESDKLIFNPQTSVHHQTGPRTKLSDNRQYPATSHDSCRFPTLSAQNPPTSQSNYHCPKQEFTRPPLGTPPH